MACGPNDNYGYTPGYHWVAPCHYCNKICPCCGRPLAPNGYGIYPNTIPWSYSTVQDTETLEQKIKRLMERQQATADSLRSSKNV